MGCSSEDTNVPPIQPLLTLYVHVSRRCRRCTGNACTSGDGRIVPEDNRTAEFERYAPIGSWICPASIRSTSCKHDTPSMEVGHTNFGPRELLDELFRCLESKSFSAPRTERSGWQLQAKPKSPAAPVVKHCPKAPDLVHYESCAVRGRVLMPGAEQPAWSLRPTTAPHFVT